MAIFSVEITIAATAYVRADTAEDAARIAREQLHHETLEVREDRHAEPAISGQRYDDPSLPDVSISPAMTITTTADTADRADDEEEG